jgi:hypothetical protein
MNNIIRYKRFTQPRMPQDIGRKLLVRFLEPFSAELQKRSLVLPSNALPASEYDQPLAGLLLSTARQSRNRRRGVKPRNTEYGKDGFCVCTRNSSQPAKNFDYFRVV